MLSSFPMLKIENFGDMQMRYHPLPLDSRASAVLEDVEPAFSTAQKILAALQENPQIAKAATSLRSNSLIISRIRNSEAKSTLIDDSIDFVKATSQKLSKWQSTLQHIAQGKTKASIVKENIPMHFSITAGSDYLALIKLIIPELTRLDEENKDNYDAMLAEIRRCSTILSDCECASELNSIVLH